jgi:glycosyltransferase involved in cell wall biosynthesis
MTDSHLRARLSENIEQASVVHIHGLWQEHGHIAGGMARALGKPYIVSVHGMLEPWALRAKRWKKSLYWNLFEKRNLQRAHCLRALTAAEAEQYRNAGLLQPIAIIPNGVEIPAEITAEPFYHLHPELRDRRILLFLGRLHHKKGLTILCQSWSEICQDHPDAHLVLAGPDSEGTKASLEAQIAALGLESRVTFSGMLRGKEKWAALRAATVFLLPSYSEGFSVAVLEAMGAGTPVMISRQCYFPEVASCGSGWVIEPEPAAISRSLRECLSLSNSDREEMGSKGRSLIESRFLWNVVGNQAADVLDWVRGGPIPRCVEIIQ